MSKASEPLENFNTSPSIVLQTPIKRAGGDIVEITLRKPAAGELRGLALVDVMQMDVNALQKLLPRISMPSITEPEVQKMDLADLVVLGVEVASFLLPKQKMDALNM